MRGTLSAPAGRTCARDTANGASRVAARTIRALMCAPGFSVRRQHPRVWPHSQGEFVQQPGTLQLASGSTRNTRNTRTTAGQQQVQQLTTATRSYRVCHSEEHSEEESAGAVYGKQIPRCARNDNTLTVARLTC